MRLSDVCELIVDSEHKTAPTVQHGYPMIRTPNIGRGRFLLAGVLRVDDETYTKWSRRARPRLGDLILAREAPVGNVAMVTSDLQPILGQRTVLIRPDPSIVMPRYLQYLLLGEEIQAEMAACSSGATVAHLNLADIRELPLPDLPSPTAQRRIASALAAYDELIENNQARIAILEVLSRTIYSEFLTNRTAERDGTISFGDIATEVREGILPASVDGDVPYVGLEHLPRRSIVLSEYGDIRDVTSRKWKFKNGDILFGKLRPYFHKVARAPRDGVCSTDAIVIRPKSGFETFALFVAASDGFVAHATSTAGGTDRPRSNWRDLAMFQVIKPSDARLEQFDSIVAPMVELMFNLVEQNCSLRIARDVLLPRLVSGQIDVSALDIDTSWLAA